MNAPSPSAGKAAHIAAKIAAIEIYENINAILREEKDAQTASAFAAFGSLAGQVAIIIMARRLTACSCKTVFPFGRCSLPPCRNMKTPPCRTPKPSGIT